MRQRAKADSLAICYRKKQIDVSFSCVCPVIDNEIGHNIVKVVCGSTRLSPAVNNRTDAWKTDVNLLNLQQVNPAWARD